MEKALHSGMGRIGIVKIMNMSEEMGGEGRREE